MACYCLKFLEMVEIFLGLVQHLFLLNKSTINSERFISNNFKVSKEIMDKEIDDIYLAM